MTTIVKKLKARITLVAVAFVQHRAFVLKMLILFFLLLFAGKRQNTKELTTTDPDRPSLVQPVKLSDALVFPE